MLHASPPDKKYLVIAPFAIGNIATLHVYVYIGVTTRVAKSTSLYFPPTREAVLGKSRRRPASVMDLNDFLLSGLR